MGLETGDIAMTNETSMTEYHAKVGDLKLRSDARNHGEAAVGMRAKSLSAVGQLQAVGVDDKDRIVFGACRYRAAKHLQWPTMRAVRVTSDQKLQRLSYLDENLVRVPLSHIELCDQLEEQEAIYNALTGRKAKRGRPSNDAKDAASEPFRQVAADSLGCSSDTVRANIATAKKLDTEAKKLLADTPVANSPKELKQLAKLPAKEQQKVAKKIAAGKAETVKEATASSQESGPSIQERRQRAMLALTKLTKALSEARLYSKCRDQVLGIEAVIKEAIGE